MFGFMYYDTLTIILDIAKNKKDIKNYYQTFLTIFFFFNLNILSYYFTINNIKYYKNKKYSMCIHINIYFYKARIFLGQIKTMQCHKERRVGVRGQPSILKCTCFQPAKSSSFNLFIEYIQTNNTSDAP